MNTISVDQNFKNSLKKSNDTNSTSLLSKFRNKTLANIKKTTVHHLADIFKSDEGVFFQIFWLIFVLLAGAGGSYFIQQTVYTYLQYNYFTITAIRQDKLNPFPGVIKINIHFTWILLINTI